MKKALALALSVCMLMSVAVFGGASAAVDSNAPVTPPDNSTTTPVTPPSTPSKSDDGSGAGSSTYDPTTSTTTSTTTSNTTSTSNTPTISSSAAQQVAQESVNEVVQEVLNSISSGSIEIPTTGTAAATTTVTAPVKLTNVKEITPAAIKSILQAAEQAAASVTEASNGAVTVQPVIHADTVQGNKVVARVYIDPKAASALNKPINTSVATAATSREARAVVSKFEKTYTNEMEVVQFAQTGSFGMPVEVAVKIDTTKINLDNAVFYNYDAASNSFKQVNVEYKLDGKGYLHLITDVGNNFIISDGKLKTK